MNEGGTSVPTMKLSEEIVRKDVDWMRTLPEKDCGRVSEM